MLGNPLALVRGMAAGMKDFFYLPAEGLFISRTGHGPVPRVGWAIAASGDVSDDAAVVFLMASVSCLLRQSARDESHSVTKQVSWGMTVSVRRGQRPPQFLVCLPARPCPCVCLSFGSASTVSFRCPGGPLAYKYTFWHQ